MIAGVITIIGYGGIPGAMRQWATWLKWLGQAMDQNTVRWIVMVTGVGLALISMIGPKRIHVLIAAITPRRKSRELVDARASKVRLARSLTRAESRITKVVDDAKQTRPTTGKAHEMKRRIAEHLAAFRSLLRAEMEDLNKILKENNLDPLDVNEVTNATDFDEMCHLIDGQLGELFAIQRSLGS